MAKLQPALGLVIGDANADRVRRHHDQQIGELQALPATAIKVISNIDLPDGVETPIPHGLGRPATWHKESTIRNPAGNGVIQEVRGGSYDRSKVIVLKATSYAATITIDLMVM